MDRSWMVDGACIEHPEVTFFPKRGESNEPAKAVCRGCSVREQCLNYALDMVEPYGVWGGTSGYEREQIMLGRGLGARGGELKGPRAA